MSVSCKRRDRQSTHHQAHLSRRYLSEMTEINTRMIFRNFIYFLSFLCFLFLLLPFVVIALSKKKNTILVLSYVKSSQVRLSKSTNTYDTK
ncbi:hypothetical protein GQ55_5G226700 [Panicum hallii var. hallii]|uniref:Uncharacterized protein n=1 Tax=Panicum hallii var. hallii TaxID=1504633 RepID=A0A2T7DJ82_9POAL|nr:hypothetical protein GQ55_5G226700 [Panicum hallii var. hallii]